MDALSGAPGVYSARFSGPQATDESNNRLLLEKLRASTTARRASFAPSRWFDDDQVRGVYRGSVEGRIIDDARGPNGFGYDPLFYYPPFGSTFGEAGDDEKFTVSHRGQALRQMLQALA